MTIRTDVLALLLCGALAAAPASAGAVQAPAAPAAAPSADQWRADLDLLVAHIEQMHPDPYGRAGRPAMEAAIAALRTDLPSLSRDAAMVRIMQLVAMVGDGHTTVPQASLRALGAHVMPIRFYVYPDGLYVQAADRRYADLIGGQVVSIAGRPVAEVQERVATVVPRDNVHTVNGRIPSYMAITEVLSGLGVLANPTGAVPVQVRVGGRLVAMDVAPVPMPDYRVYPVMGIAYTADWVDPGQAAAPLWLRHPDKLYWMEYLPERRTLYVQFNGSENDPQESLAQFARRVRAEIERQPIDRVVMDLRLHPGGEGMLNDALFLALARSPKLEERGRLVVLTSQNTFSAGVMFAAQLSRYLQTPLIGSPTAAGNKGFSNHRPVQLPGSGMLAMVSTVSHYFTWSDDNRPTYLPEVAVDLTAEDYAAGRDPVLEAAIDYRHPRDRLRAALDAAPADQAAAAFRTWKADPANRYITGEASLNTIGYAYAQAGQTDRALAVFRAATEIFPNSANVFDSLGGAYRDAGRTAEAIAAYERALALNPNLGATARALAELRAQAASSR